MALVSIGAWLRGSQAQLKRVGWLLMLGIGFCPAVVLASQHRPLRVCISDSPFPPFTHPAREAAGQRLLRQAVEAQGLALEFVPKAWRRCLRGVQQGVYDGVIGTAANLEYQAFLAFPRMQERVDERRSLGTTRMLLYRRVGSRASWNGRTFQNLNGPLLYLSGRSALKSMIESAGGQGLDYARSSEQLALMMLNGRGSLAIDHQSEVERIIRMPPYRGRFEILPKPFIEAAIYFAVGLDSYRQRRPLFEAIWWEVSRLAGARSQRGAVGEGTRSPPQPQASGGNQTASI
ncbi:hypothetical protein ACUTAF_12790 [Pseudomonas sp. SP16.1]|uniref:hypothetical protein n=1 Tax=Pseudomonas sp. SP16.1 TaxID=3458854 RepID=UPI004045868B